jgi:hypothetical protein
MAGAATDDGPHPRGQIAGHAAQKGTANIRFRQVFGRNGAPRLGGPARIDSSRFGESMPSRITIEGHDAQT